MQYGKMPPRIAALTLTLATLLWNVSSAQAGPLYSGFLNVEGQPIDFVVNSPTPFTRSVSGITPGKGAGVAFGRADHGHLGAMASVTSSSDSFAMNAGASVQFKDTYTASIPVPVGILQFTFSLTGFFVEIGGSAGVGGFVEVVSGESEDNQFISAPGTLTARVKVSNGAAVTLLSQLAVSASAQRIGFSAEADFSDSFDVTAVQLFDLNGKFLQDVTLTDDSGNTLPVASAIPEPASLTLTGVGLVSLICCGWYRKMNCMTRREWK